MSGRRKTKEVPAAIEPAEGQPMDDVGGIGGFRFRTDDTKNADVWFRLPGTMLTELRHMAHAIGVPPKQIFQLACQVLLLVYKVSHHETLLKLFSGAYDIVGPLQAVKVLPMPGKEE